jgi:hypothetical protein
MRPSLLTVVVVFAVLMAPAATEAQQHGGAQACLRDLQALRSGTSGRVGGADLFTGGGAVRGELRALYQAARVLAIRGDEEGCRMLVSRMRDIVATQQPATKAPQR